MKYIIKSLVFLFLYIPKAHCFLADVITISPFLAKNLAEKSSGYDLGISLNHWYFLLFKQSISYSYIDKTDVALSLVFPCSIGFGRNLTKSQNFVNIEILYDISESDIGTLRFISVYYRYYFREENKHKIIISYSHSIYRGSQIF